MDWKKIGLDWMNALAREDWNTAIAVLDEAIAQATRTRPSAVAGFHVSKSITYLWAKAPMPALRSCVTALKIDRANAGAWKQLGRVLTVAGKPCWARNCFAQAENLEATVS